MKFRSPNIISWYYQQFTEPKYYNCYMISRATRGQSILCLLISEGFFWSTVCQDVKNWVKSCKKCKKTKGPYNDPNVKQGLLIANHPLEILCLDFITMDHSKDGKENVLVMMDAFST